MSDYGRTTKEYLPGKNIWVDVPKVYPVGGVIDTTGMTLGNVIPAGSMCILDTAAGTIKIITSANASGAAEVDTLTITAIPTEAGNITITLNGIDYEVAVDPTTETTATKVATAIKNGFASDANWTVTSSSAVVTFTAKAVGAKLPPAFKGGTTGVTGTFAVTTEGEPDAAKVNGLLYNDVIVNTYTTGTVVYEGMVFEDMLADAIPDAAKAKMPQITYFKHA